MAKRTDEASGPLSLPADNYDLRAERGASSNDTRHSLFMLLNLNAPKGPRLGALFSSTSAQPYNIITGFDDNGDTVINDRPAGVKRNSARSAVLLETALGIAKENPQAAASLAIDSLRDGISFGWQTVLIALQAESGNLAERVLRAALNRLVTVGKSASTIAPAAQSNPALAAEFLRVATGLLLNAPLPSATPNPPVTARAQISVINSLR